MSVGLCVSSFVMIMRLVLCVLLIGCVIVILVFILCCGLLWLKVWRYRLRLFGLLNGCGFWVMCVLVLCLLLVWL